MKPRHVLGPVLLCLAALTAFIQDGSAGRQGGAGAVCAACHADGDAATGPDFDQQTLAGSAHAALACDACHTGVTASHEPDLPPVDCARCHEAASADFSVSVHAGAIASGCIACHGSHAVSPASSDEAARLRIAENCGGCHKQEAKGFLASSHGTALRAGDQSSAWAPSCVTCHGAHRIFPAEAPASPSSFGRLPATCGGCHGDPEFARAVGEPEDRLDTYKDSIHGLRNRFGKEDVATCKDCHGFHLVLPRSDPRSTIAAANIVGACGKCHESANANFAAAKVHISATPESSLGVFLARWFYVIFIAVLVVGFVLHIIFDLLALRRRKRGAAR